MGMKYLCRRVLGGNCQWLIRIGLNCLGRQKVETRIRKDEIPLLGDPRCQGNTRVSHLYQVVSF